MGILQRIAIAYLLAAICEIWLKRDDDVDSGLDLLRRYPYQLFVGLVLSFTYTVLLYGIYVPDWEYQISGPGSIEKSFSVSAVLLHLLYLVIGSAYNTEVLIFRLHFNSSGEMWSQRRYWTSLQCRWND
jgi:predicted acyltransferase